jgi:dolichol kinase
MNSTLNIAITKPTTRSEELQTELLRKTIHMFIALVPLAAELHMQLTIIALTAGILFYTWAEAQRLSGRPVLLVGRITRHASRRQDAAGFELGPVTLAFGALIALMLYPAPASTLAIYALAFGDGFSSLIGKMLQSAELPFTGGKTLAGSLACLTVVTAVSFGVIGSFPMALLIGITATIIELFPLRDLDNIMLPFGVGLLVHFILV